MKALQSLTLTILLAAGSAAMADDATAGDFVYRNKILKRRFQADRNLGVESEGDRAIVYLAVPFDNGDLHIMMGRYQDFGTMESGWTNDFRSPQTKDPKILQTRLETEAFLEGSANEAVLDELGAQPWAPGDGKSLAKNKPEAACLAESFDLTEERQIAKAVNKLENSWKNISGLERAVNNLACLYALLGRQEALEMARKLPRKPLQLLNHAHIELAYGQSNEAVKILKPLIESNAFSPGRLKLDCLCTLIEAQYNCNDEGAPANLQEALRLYPNNQRVILLAADIAMAEKNYPLAVQHLNSITTATSPEPLIKLSQCLAHQGKFDQAKLTANKAVSNFSESISAHTNLAKLYQDDKEWLGARLQYERALELKPSFAQKKSICTSLMSVLEANHDQKDLLKYTTQWVKENPDQSVTHANHAYALSLSDDKGSHEEAVKEYEQALKLPRAAKNIRYNLALLLAQLQRKDEAKVELKIYMNEAGPREKEQARQLLDSLNN